MMKYFRQILHFAKPYYKYGYLNIIFNIFYAIFSTLSFVSLIPMLKVLFKETEPLYTKPIYENMNFKDYIEKLLNYYTTQEIEANGQLAVLTYLIAFIIIVFFLKNLSNYLALFFITFLRNGILKDLREAMYEKIIEQPLAYFSEKRKGDILSRISGDVLEVQYSFLYILELLVRDPITIIITIIVMVYMSLKLTLFVLLFIPISGIIISKIGKSLRHKSESVQSEQGNFLSIVEETLGGLRIIKIFNAERLFKNKFKISSFKFFRFSNRLYNRHNLASPMSEFMGIIVISIILWQGGNLVLVEKSMNASSFIAYLAFAYNILTPAKSISKALYNIRKGDAAAKRILEMLSAKNTIVDVENPIEKLTFDKQIELRNVSFKYNDEDNYVLKNFSLVIEKGKSVALVGQSGSGKSTIANLISRFYDIDEGEILIDGINIKHISKKSLRNLFGFVTQDSILFNDTIKNNILLGKQIANDASVKSAVKVSNAYEFIRKLPAKFETNIGDSGNKLSGGQKQRLSIARAILKNPPIMLLDEATSALDTESEKLVQGALDEMMYKRTSLIIAHRLSTIQKSNLIVVLQDGQIVEKGTHDELLKNNDVYKKLVMMQTIQ